MNRAKFTILAAALGLAFIFTISCGEHSWGENYLLGNSGEEDDYSSSSFSYNGSYEGSNPLLQQTVKVGHNIKNPADLPNGFTDIVFLLKWYSANSISTFVNEDGTVTIHVSDDDAKISHIYEFSMTLELQRQLSFPYEFDMFGAFTKDSEGHYYFFYGKRSRSEDNMVYVQSTEARNDPENMAMVKYDRSGRKIKTYKRKPVYSNSDNFGVNTPFRVGCRLEVSGSLLAVYFARAGYLTSEGGSAHQASYGFILNKDTFEAVATPMPYVSHSFDQFILPINNGFVFADKGDAYPRAFKFSRFDNNYIKSSNSFPFAGNSGDNTTNAQMGGLAKTSGGYIFAGTYGEIQNRRNLFILTFDDAVTAISNPRYLTTYTERDNRSIGHPKIVGIGSGQYLLLWELYEQTLSKKFSSVSDLRNNASSVKYLSTKMQIIDGAGNPLSPVKDLKGLRLNQGEFLRYNRQNGRVYWVIKEQDIVSAWKSPELVVYALDAQYAYANDDFTLPEESGAKNGGGWGLSLRRFNIIDDKTTVSINEEFTVDHSLSDVNSTTFPGATSGAALVDDDNNIVAILGTLEIAPVTDANRAVGKKIKCKVPDTVAPGQYKLRIVVKTKGNDEWRVVTSTEGTLPTFIDFTVK
jgi:ribosomal protein L33